MPHRRTAVIIFALCVALAGCDGSRPTARSPESDALLRAARARHADTVKKLLASSPSADVDARDERGNTVLMEAALNGHDDVVQALLVAKVDVRARNDAGKTALMLAAEGGHTQTVQLLRQAGATE